MRGPVGIRRVSLACDLQRLHSAEYKNYGKSELVTDPSTSCTQARRRWNTSSAVNPETFNKSVERVLLGCILAPEYFLLSKPRRRDLHRAGRIADCLNKPCSEMGKRKEEKERCAWTRIIVRGNGCSMDVH